MDPMILSFLLIGGSIIVLILLLHNQNRYGRRETEETEQEIQKRKVAKAKQDEEKQNKETDRQKSLSSMPMEGSEVRRIVQSIVGRKPHQTRSPAGESTSLPWRYRKALLVKDLEQDPERIKLEHELRYRSGFAGNKFLPLDKALEVGVPEQTCFVYKLSVGGSDYIGFTTQDPKNRLEQHLMSAREGSQQKVHVALRRFGYIHDFEIISEHENEVLGLVAEIINIKKYAAELNTSIGGEGNNFSVVEKKSYQGEEIFFVEKNHSDEKEKVQKKHAQTEKSNLKKTRTKKSYDFAVGDEVFHNKFGIGNIVSISPSETVGKNILEIQFNEVGYKRIQEEFVVLSDLPS